MPHLIVGKSASAGERSQELIAWLKANPGKATVGHAGRRRRVAYRRAAVREADRHAGAVRALSRRGAGDAGPGRRPDRSRAAARPRHRAAAGARRQASRPMRSTAKKRSAGAPDIPTVDEAGLPGFHFSVWTGFWAPKGTPKDVIAKLNAAVQDALADPAVRKRIRGPRPGDFAARAADAGGARGLAEGRDREMVADHQGGQHQGCNEIATGGEHEETVWCSRTGVARGHSRARRRRLIRRGRSR